jgi:hypothetical protein
MEYREILNRLGPCGLSCEKCFAFKNGKIKHHSKELRKFLGNFDIYAQRFSTLLAEPLFKKYPDFKQLLAYFTKVECKGCRKTECQLLQSCQVRQCYREKKVDFCFQCNEFPCNKTGFDEHLKKRWITMNQRMKELGIEKYYHETKNKARYI